MKRRGARGHVRWPFNPLLLLLAAMPAAALDFVPCAESGHEAFDCATLDVPLDRAGAVAGTITLSVERLRPDGAERPVLIALAGGPGQSATAFARTFAETLAGVLDRYQLVVFDQRGTGRSAALDCPALRSRSAGGEEIAQCARSLGDAARLHTTADSAADLDAVREALGVDQVVVAGVSYGTHVALEYARTFPTRTAAMVLDSTVPPGGPGPFGAESLAVTDRVIRELCAGGSCVGFTRDEIADTRALVQRLGRRRRFAGVVVDEDGRRRRRTLDGGELFGILQAGDLVPLLQARYPGAVAAARRGDRAPLLRLAVLGGFAGAGAASDVDPAVRTFSSALFLATACADIRFPWQEADPLDVRIRALEGAVEAVPAGVLLPFDHATALRSGVAPGCLYWPTTSLARAQNPAPPPDVRTLILAGTRDVRTPLENGDPVARLLPQAVRVVVPSWGHSVLTGTECARTALVDFLHDRPVGDPCAGLPPFFPTEPAPPRSIGRVRPVAGVPGLRGKVLQAVLGTLDDAIVSAAAVVGAGSTVRLGGLRRGRLTAEFGAEELAVDLDRYTVVSGVAVSGSLRVTATTATADVRVGGRMAGTIRIGADGALTGTLGGRRIAASFRSFTTTAIRTRAQATVPPPIP